MKKVFFSFAFMAAVATAMASNGNTYVQSSNLVETETVQAVPDDEVPIDQQKEISSKVYTIKVPEGWTARSRMVNNSCVLALNEEPHTTASLNAVSYKSVDEYKASKEEDGFTAQEEKKKVNDREFVILEKEDEDGNCLLIAVTAWGDGSFQASLTTGYCDFEQDEKKAAVEANMQTILENIEFKY